MPKWKSEILSHEKPVYLLMNRDFWDVELADIKPVSETHGKNEN